MERLTATAMVRGLAEGGPEGATEMAPTPVSLKRSISVASKGVMQLMDVAAGQKIEVERLQAQLAEAEAEAGRLQEAARAVAEEGQDRAAAFERAEVRSTLEIETICCGK